MFLYFFFQFVDPDRGPNYLQRESADDRSQLGKSKSLRSHPQATCMQTKKVQTVLPRSKISTFVIHSMESILA